MRIAVLGTGMVGRALAEALTGLGHEVTVGTRDTAASLARTDAGGFGAWAVDHPQVRVARFAEAARGAELAVNALSGDGSVSGVGAAALENGTVLLDVSNPLGTRSGRPMELSVANTDSLAEQLQRTFPGLRVVKALNTMTARLMASPRQLAGGDFTTFICGDDAEAKAVVVSLLRELGHRDVLDLGDITAARGPEAMMLTWLRLWTVVGSPMFTFKVVR